MGRIAYSVQYKIDNFTKLKSFIQHCLARWLPHERYILIACSTYTVCWVVILYAGIKLNCPPLSVVFKIYVYWVKFHFTEGELCVFLPSQGWPSLMIFYWVGT